MGGALSFPLLRLRLLLLLLHLACHLAESMEKRRRGGAKDIDHDHGSEGLFLQLHSPCSSSFFTVVSVGLFFALLPTRSMNPSCEQRSVAPSGSSSTCRRKRWEMIAGRVPGRTPDAIERFWTMRHEPWFAERRLKRRRTQTRDNGASE
ncbi:hypothetical protein BHE74_00018449 [Ensete ventricosum]|nr:hypothetical protein GW17_00026206 [Ensete ventricosum]RWW73664.1 hypothetical protein BHE74_00018449 [Ensete ventricosum]RZR97727.1 hypothetical protein BHM03_00026964 [Ensete ventricosum]